MTRKEAREYIIKHCNPHRDTGTQWDDAMECAIKALGEPERKKGKSIVKSTGDRSYWVCDQCGTEIKYTDNFCRHCGADLRGELK